MHRNIYEILDSQRTMIGKKADVYEKRLADQYRIEIEKSKVWAKKEPNVEIIDCYFKDIIENPEEQIGKLASHLSIRKPIDEIIAVVDKSLYRSKVKGK